MTENDKPAGKFAKVEIIPAEDHGGDVDGYNIILGEGKSEAEICLGDDFENKDWADELCANINATHDADVAEKVKEAVEAERERCATIAWSKACPDCGGIAAAIRAAKGEA